MANKLNQSLHSTKNRLGLIWRTLQIAWGVRRFQIICFFFGAILETTMFILSIYASAKLGSLLARFIVTGSKTDIWLWLWLSIAAAALMVAGNWLMENAKRFLYFSMVHWATNNFQRALCNLDIPDFFDTSTRDRINKAQDGYTWQVSNFAQASLDLMYAIIRFLATAIVVAQITWWLVPLLALFLIPNLFAEAKLAKLQWFVWASEGDARHMFWGLQDIMRQAKSQMELRSSQAREYVLKKIDILNRRFYYGQERELKRFNGFVLPAQLLETVGTSIGSIFLVVELLRRVIGLDRYLFLSGALLRISTSLNNIFGILTRMQQSFLFMDDFYAIMERTPKIVDKPDATILKAGDAPEITFERVSFTYPGSEKPVFQNLNFTIKPGERLAIVGENGAGKTTLIKLLMRFYRPLSGRILIDGIDLQDIAIDSWYSQLATLFQDFNRYPFSISENIELARPEFMGDKKRLEHAARLSNVDTIVKNYKHGWETVLDNSFEKGVEPSGGQWQRVALARAFYRQANVLILDEPTAAIDAKAEYDIFNNIFAEYKGKTAIIVSHRFSTVRKADRILVFEHGKVIEDGTHKELMKLNSQYADMFNKQAEGYR